MTHDSAIPIDQSLLWTLEEISKLVSSSGNPSETLTNIVNLIQRRFETDVCSVYLLEPDRTNLVLAATVGLRPESVGRIRMRLTEGLVGLVAEQLRPQSVQDATPHLEILRETIAASAFTVRGRRRPRDKPQTLPASAGQKKVFATISIGLAGPDRHHATPEQVIKAADAALYRAKKAGRNRLSA